MKKKLFAFLTAVCCLTGGIASLSASAEDFNESEFYIVADSNHENLCYLYSYLENRYLLSPYAPDCLTENIFMNLERYSNITGDKLSSYEYGDILVIDSKDGLCSDSLSPPIYYIGGIKEIHYAGNCKELLETKELTLTNRDVRTYRGWEEVGIFDFTDEEGKEYQYIVNYYTYYNVPLQVDVNACAIGDAVTFSVYNDTAILPLELHRNVIPGDADRNGQFDILDVIYLNRVILGRDIISDVNIDVADFNQDGVPDSSDALTMLKMLVGLA